MAVYFIQDTHTKAVKIGWGGEPAARLRTLQTGCPSRLVLLGSIRGGRREERFLQDFHAPLCIRGEWFRGDPALLFVVNRLIKVTGKVSVVADECRRRGWSRTELRGVDVAVSGRVGHYRIAESAWRGERRLSVNVRTDLDYYLIAERERERSDRLETVGMGELVDEAIARMEARAAGRGNPLDGIPAEQCLILSHWPVNWLEECDATCCVGDEPTVMCPHDLGKCDDGEWDCREHGCSYSGEPMVTRCHKGCGALVTVEGEYLDPCRCGEEDFEPEDDWNPWDED